MLEIELVFEYGDCDLIVAIAGGNGFQFVQDIFPRHILQRFQICFYPEVLYSGNDIADQAVAPADRDFVFLGNMIAESIVEAAPEQSVSSFFA